MEAVAVAEKGKGVLDLNPQFVDIAAHTKAVLMEGREGREERKEKCESKRRRKKSPKAEKGQMKLTDMWPKRR